MAESTIFYIQVFALTRWNKAGIMSNEIDTSHEIIKVYCLGLLARREHSCVELLNKCLLKGFTKNVCLAVIDELAERGLQSNDRYAESYARSRMQKGFGPIAIAYELSQNGIRNTDLDTIITTVTAGSWLDLLEQVYHKKYPRSTLISRNEWAKRYQFLMQRGFPATLINSFFQQLNVIKQPR